MHVEIEHHVETAVTPSQRVLEVAAMFGLGVDEERMLSVVPRTRVPLPPGGVVFITGPSGGGKTTILHCIAREARQRDCRVLTADFSAALPAVPLVDAFDLPLERVTSLLARVGLGDAFVMLRTADQLSDGQRYRLQLARLIDAADRANSPAIIMADEFGATLDRQTACVVASNIRRWIAGTPHTFIAATTHDDLLEHLRPDVLVYKDLGEHIEVIERSAVGTNAQRTDDAEEREPNHPFQHPRRP